MPTPDEIVAAQIIEEIRKKDILPAERLAPLVEQLAQGTLSSEDWALLVELANDSKSGGTNGRKS